MGFKAPLNKKIILIDYNIYLKSKSRNLLLPHGLHRPRDMRFRDSTLTIHAFNACILMNQEDSAISTLFEKQTIKAFVRVTFNGEVVI